MNKNKLLDVSMPYVAIFFGLSLIVAIFIGFSKLIEHETFLREQKLLREKQIKIAKAELTEIMNNRSEDYKTDKIDPWGTQYEFVFKKSHEEVVTSYFAISAGPDKQMGTEDDLVKANDDLNWTNASTSVGKKTGRTVYGFFKGLLYSTDGK